MQFTGKTVEEAVEKGLIELSIKEEDAEITVIEDAVKGLFGRVKKEAVVEIEKKSAKKTSKSSKAQENEKAVTLEEVKDFVQGLLDNMSLIAKATIVNEDPATIEIIAEKASDVLGFKGENIDAIQTLAGAKFNVGRKDYKKLVVDCENYRAKREETLVALAHRLEAKATEMRREVILEPMSPFERRIIHTALSDSATVTTRSDGAEPNRFIVIVPNDKDEFSHPYNAGRNRDRSSGGRDDRKRKGGRNDRNGNRGGGNRRPSGFTEQKKKPSGFGTYLGNSLKGE